MIVARATINGEHEPKSSQFIRLAFLTSPLPLRVRPQPTATLPGAFPAQRLAALCVPCPTTNPAGCVPAPPLPCHVRSPLHRCYACAYKERGGAWLSDGLYLCLF